MKQTPPLSLTDYNRIVSLIKDFMDHKTMNFILYPKGCISTCVRDIIVGLGGRIEFYIDNLNYNGLDTLNISQALEIDTNAKILICSNAEKYFKILRKNIYEAFDKSRVIDLFWMYEDKVFVNDTDIFAGRLGSSKFLLDKTQNIADKIPKSIDEEITFLTNELNVESLSDAEKKRYQMLFSYIKNAVKSGLICRNAGNHFIPDYEFLLQKGIGNIRKLYPEQSIYSDLLKKLSEYISKYAEAAEQCGNYKIQQSCERIIYDKPTSFFDAIQLVILAHEVLVSEAGCGSISFGRIDQYLYPFYIEDIRKNVLTEENAQEYIISFLRKLAEFPLSWQNVTIGGCDAEGKDQSNELTILCMRAVRAVRGDQPQLSLRMGENTPDVVWEEAIELISLGMGFPALFNDNVAVAAKINCGVSK